jgi:hypothetical protein
MTDFVFTPLVNSPHADVISAGLGDNTNEFGSVDIGQAVKLGAAQNYVQVAAGDDIEGVVVAVDGNTVNDGYSFGSVQRDKRFRAQVGSDEVGQVAIGAEIVAGLPIALGTANGYPQVKNGSPSVYRWRVLRHVTGNGSAGDMVIIERI